MTLVMFLHLGVDYISDPVQENVLKCMFMICILFSLHVTLQ